MKSWRSNPQVRRQRRRHLAKNKPPSGSRPGTLVLPEGSPATRVRGVRYGAGELEEREIRDARELRSFAEHQGPEAPEAPEAIVWIDVQGLGSREVLQWVADAFQLHPLVLSDIVHVPQRPKAESYDGTVFLVARRLRWKGDAHDACDELQVSLVFGPRHVLTFQEREDEVLEPVLARLRQDGGQMRRMPADYLVYAILDAIIDDYFPIMDKLGERLEALEMRVVEHPSRQLLAELAFLRADLLAIRRDVWPQREALHALVRGDVGKVSEPVRLYLRDCHDHIVQVAEVIEIYRELASGLQNVYLTSIANRTNEVMKVLTIIATLFIPLTFIVGVYGMNFRYMPELDWPWAYPALWAVMIGTGIAMLLWFRRKGWIGRKPE